MKNESTDGGTPTNHGNLDETPVAAETVLHIVVESKFE